MLTLPLTRLLFSFLVHLPTAMLLLAFLLKSTLSFHSGYLLCLLLISSGIQIKHDLTFSKVSTKSIEKPDRLFWALFILIISLGIFIRFWSLDSLPIWEDEDHHNGRLLRHLNTYEVSAEIQQPPLYYYFSYVTLKLFGTSVFSVRFFPAFFSALSVLLFSMLALHSLRKKSSVLIATLLFATNTWLTAYAQEAKPYGMGLLYTLFFLYNLFTFYSAPQEGENKKALFVSALLCLLTISLQTPLLLFLLFTCGIFLSVKERDISKSLCILGLGIVLLFLPVEWNIVQNSRGFLNHPPIANLALTEFFPTLWTNATWLLKVLLHASIYAFGIMLLALGLDGKQKTLASFQKTVLAATILLPFLFVACFTLIDWHLEPRYLLIYIPLFFLAIFYAWESLYLKIQKRLYVQSILMLLFFSYMGYFLFLEIESGSKKFTEFKWAKLYSYLELSNIHGVAYVINLRHPGSYVNHGFITVDYSKQNFRDRVKLVSNWDLPKHNQARLVLNDLYNGLEPEKVLIFTTDNKNDFPMANLSFPATALPEIRSFTEPQDHAALLYQLPKKASFAKTLEPFFLAIDQKKEVQDQSKVAVRQILTGISLFQWDCKSAKNFLEKLHRSYKAANWDESFLHWDPNDNYWFLKEKFLTRCKKERFTFFD